MKTTLVVRGGRALVGTTSLPSDKSISHRALIVASLAEGETPVHNLSTCTDVRRTLDCLRDLGVRIDELGRTPATVSATGRTPGRSADEPRSSTEADSERVPRVALRVAVHGVGTRGLGGPPIRLHCGDSGTTMRLLAGVLAGQQREFVLDGSVGLRRRPMRRVVAPLQMLGAQIGDADGLPPLEGHGRPLVGTEISLEKASAQVGSAVLLAGLTARGRTAVTYPQPVRDHTERMLAVFGSGITWTETRSEITGPERLAPPPGGLTVPGDASAAANLLTAATLIPESEITLVGMGMNPGRTGFLDIARRMDAAVEVGERASRSGEPSSTVTVRSACLRAVELGGPDVPRAIDELPLIAVLGSRAQGVTVVQDAAELRYKESDRIAGIVNGLSRMGARIQEASDGFAVRGPSPLRGAEVDGCGDHRIAMALAVAALAAEGETRIDGAGCIPDSYPGFADDLVRLGADVRIE